MSHAPTMGQPAYLTQAGAAKQSSTDYAQEMLLLLAKQSKRAPLAVIMGAAILALMASDDFSVPFLVGWVAAIALCMTVRVAILQRLPHSTLSPQNKLRIANALSVSNGIAHASALLFFAHMSVPERAVESLFLIGLCTASLATTAGLMSVYLFYIVPVLTPLTWVWLYFGKTPGATPGLLEQSGAGLILLVISVLFILARDQSRNMRHAYDMRQLQGALNNRLQVALEAAEAANRAKTRFLASASHDLRQPLHTLSLFCAALSLRPLDDRSREITGFINTALRGLSDQMDALLDISKLDAGVVQPEFHCIALDTLVHRLAVEFEPLAHKNGLTLELDCPPAVQILTDGRLLERIIRNLIDNAIKYTRSGGVSITVNTAMFEQHAAVVVSDTGPGIAPEEQERVFEEFYQIGNHERDRTRGLGLGLSIVRRLSNLMGIRLLLHSEPGEGTSISLVLPRTNSTAEVLETSAPALPSLPGLHILVVDDEMAVRLGMRTLLEALDCEVSLTSSTVEAIQHARARRPDLALVDFRLRDEDNGLKAINALRTLYPDLPALLISGDTAPDRLREAHLAKVQLLHKPVKVEELWNAVSALVPAAKRRVSQRHGHSGVVSESARRVQR